MAADVVGAETGREAGFGDVGDAYRLGIGHEAEERRDRRIEAGAALRGPLAAGDDLDAPLQGVDDVRLDLLDRLHVDQGADHRTRLEPVGDLHRAGGLGEALDEGVIDAVLHQDAVGAHAGLARIR